MNSIWVLGWILRAAAALYLFHFFPDGNWDGVNVDILSGSGFANTDVMECAFLLNRSRNVVSTQFLPLLIDGGEWCYSNTVVGNLLLMFSKIVTRVDVQHLVLIIIASFFQAICCLCIQSIEGKDFDKTVSAENDREEKIKEMEKDKVTESNSNTNEHTNGYSYWTLLWANPLFILSAAASPVPALRQSFIAVCLTLAIFSSSFAYNNTKIGPGLGSIAVAIATMLMGFCFPLLWVICPSLTSTSTSTSTNFSLWKHGTLFTLVLAATVIHHSSQGLELGTAATTISSLIRPSMGLSWYLQMQSFPEHDSYLRLILYSLPLVVCLPLWLRFREIGEYGRGGRIALCATLAVVNVCDPQVSLSDALFTILLTCVLCPATLQCMRTKHPSCVFVAIIATICACVTPIVAYLWLGPGTGNANFLFFQTTGFWAMFVIIIVQFVETATTTITTTSIVASIVASAVKKKEEEKGPNKGEGGRESTTDTISENQEQEQEQEQESSGLASSRSIDELLLLAGTNIDSMGFGRESESTEVEI